MADRPAPRGWRRRLREAVRPRQRPCVVAAALVATVLLAAPLVAPPRPRLVWNASASAPVGLYRIAPGAVPARGGLVLARLAEPWRSLAAARHYLPRNVPLLKRVAARGGDRVCAWGPRLTVNGRPVAVRRRRDARGRTMPRWTGCRTLAPSEILLLIAAPDSFDGRYFGPTPRGDVIGAARLIWPA